jgi:hypothetical protein
MKKNMILVLIVLSSAMSAISQTATTPPQQVIEVQYLLPKQGMEDKFEAAVLAHNKKFHPDGPYVAYLRKIEYGPKTGWYAWVMGPTAYASLDTRPDKENGHAQDWSTTIDPLIDKYGETNLWNLNADLSYGFDIFKQAKHYESWGVDLKPGQYYRFKAIAEKLKKIYASMGTTAFIVLDNQLHTAGGADVALIWSFNTFSDWSKDDGLMAAYEKQYGAGSWQQLLSEWRDIIVDYTADVRTTIR